MARPRKKRPIPVEIIGPDRAGRYCAFVTVGVRENGRPDRRKRSGKTPQEVEEKIRALLDEVEQKGRAPAASRRVETLADWLEHWLTNVVADLRATTLERSYGWAVRTYLIPGLGGWRLDRIPGPEHLERFYRGLMCPPKPLSAKSVALIHGTLRAALNEALRRGRIRENPTTLARAPSVVEHEVEPLTVGEAQRILQAATGRRNSARWSVGLSLGLRQGEVLGLRWSNVDLERGHLWVRTQAQRHKWRHGCDDPVACAAPRCRIEPCRGPWQHGCTDPAACTRGLHRKACPGHGVMHQRHAAVGCPPPCQPGCTGHARACPKRTAGPCTVHRRVCPPPCRPGCTGHAKACPQRIGGGIHLDNDPKSRAGRRKVGLPDQLVTQLREHRRVQNAERLAALIWHDNGLVFATPYGKPIDARADWQEWKELLADAGVRDARLHDARHTAATLLLLQGVDSRTVMSIMGWSAESQRVRYQHVVDELRAEAARRVGAMLWGDPAGDSATTGATSTRR